MVDFRFDGEDIILFVGSNADTNELEAFFDEKITLMKNFNNAASKVTVWFEDDVEKPGQIQMIGARLSQAGLSIKSYSFEKPLARRQAATLTQIPYRQVLSEEPCLLEPPPLKPVKVVEGSLRSGQSEEYDGHVFVMGDSHHGSEIKAAGSVIVCGTIKGSVHAGAADPDHSFIASNALLNAYVKIGEVFSYSLVSELCTVCVIKNGRIHLIPIAKQEIPNDFGKIGRVR